MSGPAPRVWLNNGPVDLLVGCGLLTAPLLLLVAAAGAPHADALTLGFFLLALFCNQPHYMATVWRAYRHKEDILAHKTQTIWLTGLVALALVAAHIWPVGLSVLFAVYLTWSPFHYSAQNWGIGLLFLGRAHVHTEPSERRALKIAFGAAYLAWALALHTGSKVPGLYKLGLDPAWTRPAQGVLWATFVLLTVYCLFSWWPRAEGPARRGLWAVAALCLTQFLWLVLAGVMEALRDAPLDPFLVSGGALAFLHCAQYLWIIEYTERKDPRSDMYRPGVFLAVLVVGGIALFLPGPWLLHTAFDVDLLHSVLAFQAAINIHHFIVDGAIWKLRDGRVRRTLVDEAPDDTRPARARGTMLLRYVAGPVLALALLGVWALEFVRTAGVMAKAPPKVAAMAEELLPQHTPFVIRRAAARVEAGDMAGAEQILRAAIDEGNLGHEVPRALARLLTAEGKLDEALDVYTLPTLRLDHDAESLLHLSTLLVQKQRIDEARDAMRRAIAADPRSPVPWTALAALELSQGNVDASRAAQRQAEKWADAGPN